MSLHESAEMYLETIYILSLRSHTVRSIDVAETMPITMLAKSNT